LDYAQSDARYVLKGSESVEAFDICRNMRRIPQQRCRAILAACLTMLASVGIDALCNYQDFVISYLLQIWNGRQELPPATGQLLWQVDQSVVWS